jgi:hypothetical protein
MTAHKTITNMRKTCMVTTIGPAPESIAVASTA